MIDSHKALDAGEAAFDVPAAWNVAFARERILIIVFHETLTQSIRNELDEHLADERRLAGSGHASHSREHADRKVHVEPMQIVASDVAKLEPSRGRAWRACAAFRFVEHILACARLRDLLQACKRPAIENMAARGSRAWTDVDDPVRVPYYVDLVLDDEQRIAGSFNASSAESSDSVSAGCKPAEGSSST